MSGYPRLDEYGRFLRDPYEDRAIRNLNRANDPYAFHRRDFFYDRQRMHDAERFDNRRSLFEDRFRPPIVTLTEPEDRRRRSLSPLRRAGEYPAFACLSESPGPRASRNRVTGFEEAFGGYPAPGRPYSDERLHDNPFGPPRDPFTRQPARRHSRPFVPFGGFDEPRNPFAPGGVPYENIFAPRRAGRDPDARFSEQERRRRNYYRSQMAESWGVASWNEYEERRRFGL